MRTNQLFGLAVMTALVGLIPWLTGVPLLLRLFGVALTLVGLFIAYLTGSVLLTQRGAKGASGGCGSCETCSCSTGSGTGSGAAASA